VGGGPSCPAARDGRSLSRCAPMRLEALRGLISADLTTALKTQAKVEVRALRALLTALDNATAVPAIAAGPGSPSEVAPRGLSSAEIDAILEREVEDRRRAVEAYLRAGREVEASELRAEVSFLSRYRRRTSE
jgi:uncharacterized protein YqeY